jgi:hypothetical protein
MNTNDAAAYKVDEALWDAYRRYDKNAVMERLISRYLPALAFAAKASSNGSRGKDRFANQARFLV